MTVPIVVALIGLAASLVAGLWKLRDYLRVRRNVRECAPPDPRADLDREIRADMAREQATPCPECRDRPGHIAINGQGVACKTCGKTYAPPTLTAVEAQGYAKPPTGEVRCCECNGTADEPRGLCGGALHPRACK